MKHTLLIAIVCVLSARMAAQEVEVKDAMVEYAVPDITAGALLNLTPDKIIRAGSVRDFAMQLMNLSGSGGATLPGLALDFNPVLLANADAPVASLSPLLQGINMSIGFESREGMERVAAGLKWTFIDDGKVDKKNALVAKLTAINDSTYKLLRSTKALTTTVVEGVKRLEEVYAVPADLATKRTALTSARANASIEIRNALAIGRVVRNENDAQYAARLLSMNIDSLVDAVRETFDRAIASADIVGADELEIENVWSDVKNSAKKFADGRASVMSSTDAQELIEKIKQARKEYLDSMWSSNAFAIGYGIIGASQAASDSAPRTITVERQHAYATLALQLSTIAMLNAQYVFGLAGGGMTSTVPEQSHQGQLQLLIGSNSFRGIVQGGYNAIQYATDYSDVALAGTSGYDARMNIGLEFMVTGGVWFYASVGSQWTKASTSGVLAMDYGVKFSPTIPVGLP